jgi:hypothetical protein
MTDHVPHGRLRATARHPRWEAAGRVLEHGPDSGGHPGTLGGGRVGSYIILIFDRHARLPIASGSVPFKLTTAPMSGLRLHVEPRQSVAQLQRHDPIMIDGASPARPSAGNQACQRDLAEPSCPATRP